jgi:hypothetical protein
LIRILSRPSASLPGKKGAYSRLFEMTAAEELRHKHRLEKIYEEVVYQAF